jgi:hypothetical protein
MRRNHEPAATGLTPDQTQEAPMRKAKLILEHLVVESFETSVARGRGTVMGLQVADGEAGYEPANTYPECPSPLCMDTPLASCDGSCRPGCVAPQPTVDPVGTVVAG